MATLKIGELAKEAGVGVETVRFYERQGLLQNPERKDSGYRLYGHETVRILKFIRRAKELGFTLREIKSLLELRSNNCASRTEVREQVTKKLTEIDAKIDDLTRMRLGLKSLMEQCHGDGSVEGCPILNALQGSNEKEDAE